MAARGRLDTAPTLAFAARLASFAIVCALLYWGQVVLIPLALAALVTFVLSPAATRLHRLGLPRLLSVSIVVGFVSGTLGGLGWVVVGELGELAEELPSYRQNIRDKIGDLRALTRGGTLERVQTTIEGISEDIERDAAAEEAPARTDNAQNEPVRVEVAPPRSMIESAAQLAPVLEVAATAGLVMLLSIFMLIKREDLRNRLVSLAGETSLVVTTKAFAEAGERISRYLLMQLIINATMGLAVWLGLYFIGVPYSALWGLAAAVLRYIPYLGPWIAALLPIGMSLITSPDWQGVVLVVALFVTLELLSNNLMEPLLYGHSVGLSPIAIILAMIFWTWLWGPVGLVLATPLTVCLVVLGKYVPGLAVADRLLGHRPALQPHLSLYQRLLARDEDEAGDILDDHRAQHTLAETCEGLLLGALLALKHDLAHGRIAAEDGEFVASALGAIAEDLAPQGMTDPAPAVPEAPRAVLIGLPAGEGLDEIALELLRALLRERQCELEILSPELLIGERIADIEERAPAAVCIPSLPPGDLTATRNLCKRLRARLPEQRLVIGRLGAARALERARQLLHGAGADEVAGTLAELSDTLASIARAGNAAAKAPPSPAEPSAAVSVSEGASADAPA